jgi:DNA primase
MAEAGSFADRVKQQADIVRVVGEYVRLKKNGQNFTGLCPFHSEKTPSFAVHPIKQIYHCFGCGVGGDVFKFVMEMDKCDFMEAVRSVADKCGIAIPAPRERSPEERREQQQRTVLVEMHREAAGFFARQLEGTSEGKAARGYLADRGLDEEAIARFGLGYAPSGGDAVLRYLKAKYPGKLIELAGLASRDASGRPYDRFRRRIMFPISNEAGKVVAFGGRALGEDLPKYLNSPETPIYVKSSVLYHLDRAKEAIRTADAAILVEGYMDTIAVARGGFGNVVASCGTSLTESQVKLVGRFTRRIIVNYDPDTAGQAATERSLSLLLEHNCDVRVLALPGGKDPDTFIRTEGAGGYGKLLESAPAYLDYLIGRARQSGLATAEQKLRAMNFLMPFVQRIPNALLRSEWASRIAQQLQVDEPVLREALRRAAAERRSEVKTQALPGGNAVRPAERRLVQILMEQNDFREKLSEEIRTGQLHIGLDTERIFSALVELSMETEAPDPNNLAAKLREHDRRLFFEIAFESGAATTWEEAESCLEVLQRRKSEQELAAVQQKIEALAASAAAEDLEHLRQLQAKKLDLKRQLAGMGPRAGAAGE